MKVYVLHMFDTDDEDLLHTSVHATLEGAQKFADEYLIDDCIDGMTEEPECWSDPTLPNNVTGWHNHAVVGGVNTWNAVCSYMDGVISELEVQP